MGILGFAHFENKQCTVQRGKTPPLTPTTAAQDLITSGNRRGQGQKGNRASQDGLISSNMLCFDVLPTFPPPLSFSPLSLSLSLSLCLSLPLSVCLSPSVCLFHPVSVSLSLCLSLPLSVCLSLCLSLSPSVSLYLCLSVSLCLSLSLSLSLCSLSPLQLFTLLDLYFASLIFSLFFCFSH